jgi:hypothetical protein
MAIKTFKDIINNKGYRVNSDDRNIFEEGNLQSFFGLGDTDAIEFIVYDANDNQLPQRSANGKTIRYVPLTTDNINDYFLIAEGTLLKKFQFPNEYFIDAERLLREAGYDNGIFKTQITLINKRVGSDKANDKLWISEISPSRTEVRLFPIKNLKVKNPELEERFSLFVSNKEFRDDTINSAFKLIEKVDSNIIGTYLKTQYSEAWVNKMIGEFKIKSFDEFVARINGKFRESASYEFTNRISEITDINYGKRKKTKNPISLGNQDILNICKRLILNAINFYLPKQDLRDTATFDAGLDESFDEVGEILQSEESDLLVDTSSPVINEAKAKQLTKTNVQLELEKKKKEEEPYPTKGTFLSKFCEGFDLYGKYADGFGGEYKTLILANSEDCGYTQPTPTTTQPPSGGGGGGGGGGGSEPEGGGFTNPDGPRSGLDARGGQGKAQT